MKKISLSLFVAFAMFIFGQNSSFCSETKFMVLSDVHISLSKKDAKARELTQSISYLQKAVNQINESNVDFVVFSGDMLDKPDKKTLVMFAKIIKDLNKPYYIIAGNHDTAKPLGLDKKEFYRVLGKFSKNKIHKVPTLKIVKNGPVLIFMDGVNQYIPGSSGYYKDDELIWLESKLKKYKNKKVIIVQHFPLIEPRERSSHTTHKADKYLALLSGYDNVVAIISGHYHAENEILKDGILHISVPALVEGGEYKEINFEQSAGKENFLIKTKIHSVK